MAGEKSSAVRDAAMNGFVALFISMLCGAIAFYVTVSVSGALHAQKIESLERLDADKEVRLRSIEAQVGRIDQNVTWIKENIQRSKNP